MTTPSIQYDFSSSTFRQPNTTMNIAPGDNPSLYDGTIVNNASIDNIGVTNDTRSILLDSTKQHYVNIPPFSTTSSGLSFSFVFKSNNTSSWGKIFDLSNGAGSDNILCYINNGNLGFGVYIGSTAYLADNVVSNVNNNTWYNIAWTLTNGSGWNIYVNGNPYYNDTSKPYPNAIFRNLNYIGKSNWEGDPYLNGNVSDFRIYNSVLSPTDVTAIYNNDKTALNITSGDAVINTGFNQLYNQIFCDLFPVNNGFNQCKNCNYGQQQVYNTSTQVGEQNCLNACNAEPRCTSYSYDTNSATNNCKQYISFPDQIVNGVNGINSGYSLGKYTYDFTNLNSDQQKNVQNKCLSQYLDNRYTNGKNLDLMQCNTISTSDTVTKVTTDPTCIFNLFSSNSMNPKTITNSNYNVPNTNLNLNPQSDPTIDNYETNYSGYISNLGQISNINTKLASIPSTNDINYTSSVSNSNSALNQNFINSVTQKTQEINNSIENFDNIYNVYHVNYNKLIVLLLIIILFILILYTIIKNNK